MRTCCSAAICESALVRLVKSMPRREERLKPAGLSMSRQVDVQRERRQLLVGRLRRRVARVEDEHQRPADHRQRDRQQQQIGDEQAGAQTVQHQSSRR